MSESAAGTASGGDTGGAGPGAFFVAGGALLPGARSYVARRADDELYAALAAGELCSVLDTRQVGKSSLLVRAAARLAAGGATVCQLDLSALASSASLEQWYAGLLFGAAVQLDAADPGAEARAWEAWANLARRDVPPGQRFFAALCAALPEGPGRRVYLFADEIDAVRGLAFRADSFFAGVREIYQRRGTDPCAARLVFCLAGAATPSQILDDVRTTPFNVGRRVELSDFTPAEASPLAEGFARGADADAARTMLARVLWWTGGHPYLTQRLCQAAAENGARSRADVDALCAEHYRSRKARETDSNLTFARDVLLGGDGESGDPETQTASEARAAVLTLYDAVLRRHRYGRGGVPFDPGDPTADLLRLSGVVRVTGEGRLAPRNRVYAALFDRRWVRQNLPGAELRRQRQAVRRGVLRASLVWGVIAAAVFAALYQGRVARVAAEGLTKAQKDRTLLSRAVESLNRQRGDLEAQTARARIRRAAAEADAARAKGDLGALTAREADARKRLTGLETAGREAAAALAAARKAGDNARRDGETARRQAAEEAKRAGEFAALVQARDGLVASGLSRVRGQEFAALERGVQAVQSALERGGAVPTDALQGLADAVNVGIFRVMRLPHDAPLTCADFSRDGSSIIVAGNSPNAVIHDAATGEVLQELVVHDGTVPKRHVSTALYSRDGRWIATTANDGDEVQLWDTSDTRRLRRVPTRRFTAGRTANAALAWFPDSRRIVVSAPRSDGGGVTLRVYDIESGTWREWEKITDTYICSVDVSEDGKYVVTGCDGGKVEVWNAATGNRLAENTTLTKAMVEFPVTSRDNVRAALKVRFRHDQVVCSGKDILAFAWIWERNHSFRFYQAHTDWIWSHDDDGSFLVTASRDGTVRVWNKGMSHGPLWTIDTHARDVYDVRFHTGTQRLVTAGKDGNAEVWQIARRVVFNSGSTMRFATFAARDAGHVGFLGGDGMVARQKLGEGNTRGFFQNKKNEEPTCIAFTPDGDRMLVGDSDGRVTLWDMDGPYDIVDPATSPHARVLFRHENGRWPLRPDGQEVPQPPVFVGFSADGSRLVSVGYRRQIWVADGRTGRTETTFSFSPNTHPDLELRPTAASLSASGRWLALGCNDGTVRVVDMDRRTQVRVLEPEGNRRIPGNQSHPVSVALSDDGTLLTAGWTVGPPHVWETHTGRLLARLEAGQTSVNDICFSPDGKTVAMAQADRQVSLWHVAELREATARRRTAKPWFRIDGHIQAVNSVRFSVDGQQIVTASADGTSRFFPATPEAYVREASRILSLRPDRVRQARARQLRAGR